MKTNLATELLLSCLIHRSLVSKQLSSCMPRLFPLSKRADNKRRRQKNTCLMDLYTFPKKHASMLCKRITFRKSSAFCNFHMSPWRLRNCRVCCRKHYYITTNRYPFKGRGGTCNKSVQTNSVDERIESCSEFALQSHYNSLSIAWNHSDFDTATEIS
eukprot:10122_4